MYTCSEKTLDSVRRLWQCQHIMAYVTLGYRCSRKTLVGSTFENKTPINLLPSGLSVRADGKKMQYGDPAGVVFLTKNASAGVGATLFGVCEHGAFIGSPTSGEDNEKRWPLYNVAEMPLMKAKM